MQRRHLVHHDGDRRARIEHDGGTPVAFGQPDRTYALGLGCDISYADQMVYAAGLDLKSAPVARLGVACRICPRPDCELRAFPPLDREIRTDPDVRNVVPFTLS